MTTEKSTLKKLNSDIDIFIENIQNALPLEAAEATRKRCKPFSLGIMVFSPQSGYRIEIDIELNCSRTNDELWKIAFLLKKRIKEEGKFVFVDLVAVNYTAKDAQESEAIANITDTGLTDKQLDTLQIEVFPPAKDAGERGRATPEEAAKIEMGMRKVVRESNE